MNNSYDPTVAIVIGLACFLVYFLPVVAAGIRKVKNWGGIFALNLFLGWTVIGWLAAMIWACSAESDAVAKSKVIDYDKLAAAMQAQQPAPAPTTAIPPSLGT